MSIFEFLQETETPREESTTNSKPKMVRGIVRKLRTQKSFKKGNSKNRCESYPHLFLDRSSEESESDDRGTSSTKSTSKTEPPSPQRTRKPMEFSSRKNSEGSVVSGYLRRGVSHKAFFSSSEPNSDNSSDANFSSSVGASRTYFHANFHSSIPENSALSPSSLSDTLKLPPGVNLRIN